VKTSVGNIITSIKDFIVGKATTIATVASPA
jgi:hypothetical protein